LYIGSAFWDVGPSFTPIREEQYIDVASEFRSQLKMVVEVELYI
jgi:hypothetical protein